MLSTEFTADESLRNAAKAIADATTVCELSDWKDADILDTLSAAYAASGEIDQAWERCEIDERFPQALRDNLGAYSDVIL